MRNLLGIYCFAKLDLTIAYNQIKLAPKCQKRLAISNQREVLLQMWFPFGTKSAPGYLPGNYKAAHQRPAWSSCLYERHAGQRQQRTRVFSISQGTVQTSQREGTTLLPGELHLCSTKCWISETLRMPPPKDVGTFLWAQCSSMQTSCHQIYQR